MRIHHIAISVKNLEESVSFYKDNFKFLEIDKFTKPGWNGSAVILQLNDINLEIFGFNDFLENQDDISSLKTIGVRHIGIQVESVLEKYHELKSKGIDIDEPVKGTTCAWFCFLRDPNGIPVELYETN
jgi:catechol 2,3-dioxygenase-like lactoylglutathione lyase family enzyme